MSIFDSLCFGAKSLLFIPAFKGSQKPTLNNNETKQPDEGEARERLKTRKEYMQTLADVDDVIRYNKYHVANLVKDSERQRGSNRPPSTSTSHPPDPHTSLPISLHPIPTSERAQIGRVTPCTPTPRPTSSGFDDDQTDGQTNKKGRRGGHREAVDEEKETKEFGGVAGEIEATQGRSPPPHFALVRRGKRVDRLGEHDAAYAGTFTVERRVPR